MSQIFKLIDEHKLEELSQLLQERAELLDITDEVTGLTPENYILKKLREYTSAETDIFPKLVVMLNAVREAQSPSSIVRGNTLLSMFADTLFAGDLSVPDEVPIDLSSTPT